MFKYEEGEHTVKVVRRHYLVILPHALFLFLLAFLPLIAVSFLLSDVIPWSDSAKDAVAGFVSEWKVFSYSLWLLVLWVVFFIEWTDYYLDLWVITNRRIIDVEQKGFFHREVTSFRYEQIQDITVETHGLVETFLKFGTLHIQTAGHDRKIVIRDAHHPEEARTLILKLSEQSKSTAGQ